MKVLVTGGVRSGKSAARRVAAAATCTGSPTSLRARPWPRTTTPTGQRGSRRTARAGPAAGRRVETRDLAVAVARGTGTRARRLPRHLADRGPRRGRPRGTPRRRRSARSSTDDCPTSPRRVVASQATIVVGDQRGRAWGGARAPVGAAVPGPARHRSTSGSAAVCDEVTWWSRAGCSRSELTWRPAAARARASSMRRRRRRRSPRRTA